MTEVVSNTATANVLLPILLEMSLTLCVNPTYLGKNYTTIDLLISISGPCMTWKRFVHHVKTVRYEFKLKVIQLSSIRIHVVKYITLSCQECNFI